MSSSSVSSYGKGKITTKGWRLASENQTRGTEKRGYQTSTTKARPTNAWGNRPPHSFPPHYRPSPEIPPSSLNRIRVRPRGRVTLERGQCLVESMPDYGSKWRYGTFRVCVLDLKEEGNSVPSRVGEQGCSFTSRGTGVFLRSGVPAARADSSL